MDDTIQEPGMTGGHRDEIDTLREQLRQKDRELETLLRVTRELRTTFDIEELSRRIVQTVDELFQARRVSLCIVDEDRGDLLVKGARGLREDEDGNIRLRERGPVTRFILEHGHPVTSSRLEPDLEDLIGPSGPSGSPGGYETSIFMAVPVKIDEAIRAIINVADPASGRPFEAAELELLSFLGDQVAVTLRNFDHSRRLIEDECSRRELRIAKDIQARMLPSTYPEHPAIRIAARSLPAKSVGGDYFDFYFVGSNKLAIFVGDVAGKGVPAALVMVMLRSMIRSKFMHTPDPVEILQALDKLLRLELEGELFVTLFYGLLDLNSGALDYTNAGHQPPLILRANGTAHAELESVSFPLGFGVQPTLSPRRARLKRGDQVVLVTDGVTEARSIRREFYGEERLQKLLDAYRGKGPDQILQGIFDDVDRFAGGRGDLQDDITVSIVQWVGE